ncbi:hypothetical protein CLAFUW4_14226 [Fulvia fulva]|nr:hypothetical protein CLAFUR4_14229 [Fulvia fulva]WPV21710.1 hypothetical protein CLAFUW4_14226 [Fulvia fulva]WPV36940.1 hypothetical protein CLAFUW7_14237 [Fulvia fulva]
MIRLELAVTIAADPSTTGPPASHNWFCDCPLCKEKNSSSTAPSRPQPQLPSSYPGRNNLTERRSLLPPDPIRPSAQAFGPTSRALTGSAGPIQLPPGETYASYLVDRIDDSESPPALLWDTLRDPAYPNRVLVSARSLSQAFDIAASRCEQVYDQLVVVLQAPVGNTTVREALPDFRHSRSVAGWLETVTKVRKDAAEGGKMKREAVLKYIGDYVEARREIESDIERLIKEVEAWRRRQESFVDVEYEATD